MKAQEFNKSVRGYDKDEVKAFLEALSNEFERLQNENDKVNSKLEIYVDEITEFKKLEKTLQATLVNAQESSSKAVESAKKQNQLIVKEAEIKAQQLIEKAKEEADIIRTSVLNLKEEKNLLIAKLKAIIESQAGLIDMTSNVIEPGSSAVAKKENGESEIDVDDILEKLL
ncbi:MAG: DivIVA domain-containing protein [Candidatus Pacebacteria bacterium]|nr:DivIVA domain-containing protein [Candidatus Paceibacterota bacterium]